MWHDILLATAIVLSLPGCGPSESQQKVCTDAHAVCFEQIGELCAPADQGCRITRSRLCDEAYEECLGC